MAIRWSTTIKYCTPYVQPAVIKLFSLQHTNYTANFSLAQQYSVQSFIAICRFSFIAKCLWCQSLLKVDHFFSPFFYFSTLFFVLSKEWQKIFSIWIKVKEVLMLKNGYFFTVSIPCLSNRACLFWKQTAWQNILMNILFNKLDLEATNENKFVNRTAFVFPVLFFPQMDRYHAKVKMQWKINFYCHRMKKFLVLLYVALLSAHDIMQFKFVYFLGQCNVSFWIKYFKYN